MKVACPRCGAADDAPESQREVACARCGHRWTPESAGAPEPGGQDDGGAIPLAGDPGSDDAGAAPIAVGAGPTEGSGPPSGAEPPDDDAEPIPLGDEPVPLDAGDVEEVDEGADAAPKAEAAAAPSGGVSGGGASEAEEERDSSGLLFRRRRRLSETDVAMIGTYQRRSQDLEHGAERVYPSEEGPSEGATDPGDTGVVGGGSAEGAPSPSGRPADGASDTTPTGRERGGGGGPSETAAFGAERPGPADTAAFGAGGSGGGPADTAAFGAERPGGGGGSSGNTAAFGAGGGGGSGGRPADTAAFGQAAPSSSGSDDPFAGFDDGGSGDPLDSMPLDDDPFASPEPPAGGEASGTAASGQAPAGESAGEDDGGLDELDFSALGDDAPDIPAFGPMEEDEPDAGAGEEAAAGAVADPEPPSGTTQRSESGESLLEVDAPGGPGAAHPGAAGSQPGAASPGARKRREGRGGSRMPVAPWRIALAAVLLVVAVGVVMGQTPLGYFGLGLLGGGSSETSTSSSRSGADRGATATGQRGGEAGDSAPPQPESPRAGGASIGGDDWTMDEDAATNYVQRIEKLQGELESGGATAQTRSELLQLLLRLRNRYPSVYDAKPSYQQTLDRLMGPKQLQRAGALRVQKQLASDAPDEAARALGDYIASKVEDPDDLYLMARVEEERGRMERAVAFHERTLELAPAYEPALHDLGRIHLERENFAEAKEYLERLLKENPKHASGKLALARIHLYQENHDQAEKLIEEALTVASKTNNNALTFRGYRLEAKLARARGNTEARRRALQQAVDLRPGHEETVLTLAELLNDQGQHEKAMKRLKTCQEAECSSASFFKVMIDTHRALGHGEKARKLLDRALEEHPDHIGLTLAHARFEASAGQHSTAEGLYRDVIEQTPDRPEPYLDLSRMLSKQGATKKAIEVLKNGIDRVDEPRELLDRLADLQLEIGATIRAKETMARIVELDPDDTDAKRRFAELLARLGFPEESRNYYEELRKAGALDDEGMLGYAEILIELGDLKQALKRVETVLSTSPKSVLANVLKGAIHRRRDDHAEARTALERALELEENDARALYELGRVELAQGNLDEAIDRLTRATEQAGDRLTYRHHLARALAERGGASNVRKAIDHYTRIIERYEELDSKLEKKRIDPDVYLERGELYFQRNQFDNSLADFKQAMVLDPTRDEIIVNFAKNLRQMGRSDKARRYLDEVLGREPDNAAAHYHLGVIALNAERTQDAKEHFKQAVAEGGDSFPKAHRHLGYLYKDEGLKALSCDAFERYLSVAPEDDVERRDVQRLVKQSCP